MSESLSCLFAGSEIAQSVYETLFTMPEILMLILNREGGVSKINQVACEVLGIEASEIIGKNWFQYCLPPEQIESVYDEFLALIDGKREMHSYFENPILNRLTGTETFIGWNNHLLYDAKGDILGVLCSGKKIDSLHYLEEIEKYSPLVFCFLLDIAKNYFKFGFQESILRVLEFIAEQTESKRVEVYLGPQAPNATPNFFWESERSGTQARKTYLHQMDWVSTETLNLQLVLSGKARPYQAIDKWLAQFLSQILQVLILQFHQTLEQTHKENQSAQILQALDEGLLVYDLVGELTLYNPAALRILRVKPESIKTYRLGLNLRKMYYENGEVCSPEDYAACLVLRTGKPCHRQTLGIDLPSGERIWISQNADPLTSAEDGALQGVIVTFRDVTERMSQVKQLQARQRELKEAQRIARLGFWEWDILTHQVHWSPEVYRIIERDPQTYEATYPNFLNLIPAEDKMLVEAAVKNAVEGLQPYDIDHRIILPQGKICYVHDHAEVIRDENGKALKLVGVVQDITERKLTEQALKAEQVRLSLALENVDLGLAEWDLDAQTVYIDPRMAQILGCSPGCTLTHADFQAFYRSDESERISTALRQIIWGEEQSLNLEFWIVRTDGEERFLRVRGKSLCNEQGKPYKIIGLFSDLTDHKRIEEELEEQVSVRTQKLEQALLDKNRRVQELRCLYAIAQRLHENAHTTDLIRDVVALLETGFSEPGLWCFELELPGDTTGCDCANSEPEHEIEIFLDTDLPPGYLRILRGCKQGSEKHVLSQQNLDLLTGVAHLVGQTWKRFFTQEQLLLARAEADKANRSKSLFLANMSHEIRTPLTAIQGFSELLQAELNEPRLIRYLEIVRNNSQVLLALLQDILDLSKVEAGKLVIQPSPLELKGLLQDVYLMYEKSFKDKNLHFELILPEQPVPLINLDEYRLRQILTNLISNALKFTPSGQVSLRLNLLEQTADELSLELIVQDTGLGIPDAFQERLFRPFEQYQANSNQSGSGLGLSISHSLAKLMGGELSYRTSATPGSCFVLRLKHLMIVQERNLTSDLPIDSPVEFEKALVFIVDDIAENREYLQNILQKWGLETQSFSCGDEVLAQAELRLPELILMDLRMPGMSGLDVLKLLKQSERTAQIPVLALTASGLQGEEQKMLAQGFSDYLRKPFQRQALLSSLQHYLSHCLVSNTENKFYENKMNRSEIIDEIEKIWIPACDRLKDSVIINQMNAFASELQYFAVKNDLFALLRFAERLQKMISEYDLVEVPEMMLELKKIFKSKLEKLKST
ncbi:hypothetical protein COW36_15355 [bacterium (Candidatus Blackallbacteria) CG17_big_fil_post_rev_8_21_14_2_50_48_46]|uniref:histidine kinase n=1 Tax=bacterium (Candidatus Blackallbacteria) CG17_big_fil_post_rev_8_21_14_2_50_48_46 TaxID=2014261 RepID=A0A2M7G2R3_9BACT|nr:MAG: hypothetical protein COW64_11195 [bacterium (Candidatus Blackallbacteria) CG18_big_fil_WC_8_21_14_2_50_49_26]PIW16086.1 MAG: hypothetical protein COW36_15355 [bacterium (Candidatus Blackallbacteria) CG17_big_fil_post_rev_8_21_14_2_50_48_46]PIW50498.1 MAG: hypothetical protein COW20_03070 [bacterium (Candidatus Blackallbacteria) CG13_big_fil_rev_8_21_14_2_50_49_14]